jgi:hypothetical protein
LDGEPFDRERMSQFMARPQVIRNATGCFVASAVVLLTWCSLAVTFPIVEAGGLRAASTRIVIYV